MKTSFYVILFLSLAFISCDGRDKIYKTNQEILKEHKLYKSFSESISYIPESYLETSTDTILSTGFQVKIKSYTDMENSILKEYTKGNILHKTFFRDINTSISIIKDNQEIVSTAITKQLFKDYYKSTHTNFNHKIIQGIWLNQYASIINNKIIVDIQLYEPKTEHYEYYTLGFDNDGTFFINNQEKQEFS